MLNIISVRRSQNGANDPGVIYEPSEDAMTAKRSSGAHAAPDKTPFMFAVMPNPAMQSLVATQRVALEAARLRVRCGRSVADGQRR